MSLHISLAAEKVFQIGDFPITNSMLSSVIVTLLLTLFALAATTPKKNNIPTTIWHHLGEYLVESFQDLTNSIAGIRGPKFFPLITTIFLFIITSNWFGLLPGVSSIGIYHESSIEEHTLIPQVFANEAGQSGVLNNDPIVHNEEPLQENTHVDTPQSDNHQGPKFTPFFRAPTADLNTTLALSLIAIVTIQVTGFRTIGTKAHIGKFINFSSPIDFFVGILELVGELSKIVSFAFRLFGNIVAGEILLAVIAYLIPLIAVLPFYGLEIFVGFIQAYVFAILTLVFSSLAMESHGGHDNANH